MSGQSRAAEWCQRAGSLLFLLSVGARAEAQTPPTPLRWAHSDPALAWAACPPIFPKGCEVTVLHGDPTTGPSDVYLRATGDYTFPAHSHTSAEHIVLVAGVLQVTYPDGKTVELQTGHYALVPAKLAHKAHCAAGAACVLFISFDSPIDAMAASAP